MKDAERVVYLDRRNLPEGTNEHRTNWSCSPNVLADFRRLPFRDMVFDLVCFDPPHRINDGGMEQLTGIMLLKYGALQAETWRGDLRAAFDELWRVLRRGGTLTFKWADETKGHDEVLGELDQTPLYGVTTTKHSNVTNRWWVFHKPRN